MDSCGSGGEGNELVVVREYVVKSYWGRGRGANEVYNCG